jgi:antirestriction protein ArdC
MSNKVYDYVTECIIKRLEQGEIPWKQGWIGNALNYVSRKPYRGINLFLLKRSGEYLTFRQVKELGGSVKKGSKSEMVVFYKVVDKKAMDKEEINQDGKNYFILRYYNVFHLSDVEGVESKIVKKDENPIDEAEKIIEGYCDRPIIEHKDSNKAYYSP